MFLVEYVCIILLSVKKSVIEEGKFLLRESKTKRRLENFTSAGKVGIFSFLKDSDVSDLKGWKLIILMD